jgi:hypothetical protein
MLVVFVLEVQTRATSWPDIKDGELRPPFMRFGNHQDTFTTQ